LSDDASVLSSQLEDKNTYNKMNCLSPYHVVRNRTLITVTFGLMAGASLSAAVTVVAENFDGSSDAGLDTKVADTFDSGITSAGGSNIWASTGLIKQDGAVVYVSPNLSRSANLYLGSYINDTKGTANGLFDLTMTIDVTDGSEDSAILALGFSSEGAGLNTINDFVGYDGQATVGLRKTRKINTWAGTGAGNSGVDSAVTVGARTLTASLDLTTWDGVTDFGSVVWSDSVLGELRSYNYTVDTDFNYILLSVRKSAVGSFDNLSLTQIPEPGSYALIGGLLALSCVMVRRRT
jgi:hypothetical protein